jgi:carboxyl-terminal processing protease
VITEVGGVEVSGWTLDDALVKIKEQIDAGEVRLTLRQPTGVVRSFTLTPGPVIMKPVEYELLDGGIGLITVKNFESLCASRTEAAVNELAGQGAKALVFDLRSNPGGQLDELLDALDYILPEGVIFISKGTDGSVKEAKSQASCVELPMAVLVNGDTYSAAEFFAAALSEYGWAVTVGEKTTGKGYAQITVELADGSAIHISSMEYYTPKGRSLAGTGLTPDIQVEMSDQDRMKLYSGSLAREDDAQLAAALNALRAKLKKAA